MLNSEEGGKPYGNINNMPKLRFPSQDDASLKLDPNNTTSRILSPTGTNNRLASFLSTKQQQQQSQLESEIKADLSTAHTDIYYDKKSYLYNLIPPSRHFVISENLKFILNCCMWYMSSSLTNNIGKSIMISFSFPITLTFVQFFLVAFWCYLVSILFGTTRIRTPNSTIVKTIAPLAVFLIVGHVFSSIAISQIPISLVHTIKVKNKKWAFRKKKKNIERFIIL